MKTGLIIFLFLPLSLRGQLLEESSRVAIPVKGTTVVVYAMADCAHCYYYLPPALHVSQRHDTHVLEASFISWEQEGGSPAGGIFHVLTDWGLPAHGEDSVQATLRKRYDSLAVLSGPAVVRAAEEGIRIVGKDNLSTLLTRSVQRAHVPPTTPGARMALSFRFDADGVQEFKRCLREPEGVTAMLAVTYYYALRSTRGSVLDRPVTLQLPFKTILKQLTVTP
ncbi:hypothetical protein [Dawidia soli]|uniref:Uncharacterized protein n=1 Tax=Dawidia soli TaxID=2782352 RepID=A0AAP2DDW2_9BACT|nr:hypothetical protein [Dawidia soli]MBT1687597.1 hypothetical protein [Dawidia soli]